MLWFWGATGGPVSESGDIAAHEVGMDLDHTLRSLSSQDFLSLGVSQVAYVKPLEQDGHSYYAIYAADGTKMAVLASREAAQAIIRQNDMEPLTLH